LKLRLCQSKALVLLLVMLMLVTTSLTLGACSGTQEEPTEEPATEEPSAEEEGPKEGGTLIIAVSADPVSLDPHLQADWSTRQGIVYMFDALVDVVENDAIAPSLAESWEVSDDGMVWTFHLRDDVTFHDGTKFNAEAVKFNMERLLDEEFASPEQPHVAQRLDSVEVVDDYTVKMHMKEVDINWLVLVSAYYMVSPTAVESMGEEFAQHPVGTGGFKFKSFATGSHVEMVRYDDYWDGAPLLDGIKVRIIPEDSTQLMELQAGNIDIAYNYAIVPKDVEKLENAGVIVERRLTPSYAMLAMNLAEGPTVDLKVRQALAHAIDRDMIIEEVLLGAAEKSVVGLPSVSPLFNKDLPMIEYDPEKAGQLLDEAGWTLGDDGIRYRDGEPLELNILTSDREERVLMSQILDEQFKAIGIKSELTTLEWGAFLDACRAGEYDVTYWILYGSSWANNTASANIRSGRHWNIFQIDKQPALAEVSERMDYLLDTFEQTVDEDKRVELVREWQQLMRDNMIIYYLWNEANFNAAQPWVKDYKLYNYNLFFLDDTWLDK